jgi:Diguanylate cyclase, GGDEF domain
LFFLSLERQRGKTRRHGQRDETEREGGWQGVRESAVSAKRLLGYGLARKRRSPKRPSEPRPSGVHPEEAQWDRRREATEKYSLVRVAERSVAKWQEQKIRGSDAAVRYGGDEFLVLLADTTSQGAQKVIDRIYGKVEEWNDAEHLEGFRVSLSIGVAEWRDGQALDEVLDSADHKMFEQKNQRSVLA